MKYIDYSDFKLEKSAVCLGKFDGVHIGHRELIRAAVERKKQGLRAVIFTFLMNPRVLNGDKELRLIYTEEEKRQIMEEAGADVLVSYPFDQAMFSMEPERFVSDVLLEKMDTKVLIVGRDFHFGHNRTGDVILLEKLSKQYGFELITFDKVMYEGVAVSSTRIRHAIAEGSMEKVNQMLGKPYRIMGEVIHGRKLGRTLGIPTINMLPEEVKLLPPNGVYASKIWIQGVAFYGISNIGVKPTVGAEKRRLMETYIFDYSGDLYGEYLKVDLYQFERPEVKFDSIEELKVQMLKDEQYGRAYFKMRE
ncbi:MAG: riboflavin kinase / adenylyltransferase [Clostridiales bacterium]|nr:riboflavin kinase / adenylyltransferase [Clostridiales bacterium]